MYSTNEQRACEPPFFLSQNAIVNHAPVRWSKSLFLLFLDEPKIRSSSLPHSPSLVPPSRGFIPLIPWKSKSSFLNLFFYFRLLHSYIPRMLRHVHYFFTSLIAYFSIALLDILLQLTTYPLNKRVIYPPFISSHKVIAQMAPPETGAYHSPFNITGPLQQPISKTLELASLRPRPFFNMRLRSMDWL